MWTSAVCSHVAVCPLMHPRLNPNVAIMGENQLQYLPVVKTKELNTANMQKVSFQILHLWDRRQRGIQVFVFHVIVKQNLFICI